MTPVNIASLSQPPTILRTLTVSRFLYTRPKPASGSPKRESRADREPIAPSLLTVPEACAVLRVSKWTLYQLIRTRQLETIKIGSRRCVPISAVHALIERLRAEEAA